MLTQIRSQGIRVLPQGERHSLDQLGRANANDLHGHTGQFTVKIYPSGDFSIGNNQPVKRDRTPDPLDGFEIDGFGIVQTTRTVEVKPDVDQLFKIAEKYEEAGNDDLAYKFGIAAAQAADLSDRDRNMGSSDASNSHRIKKVFKRRGHAGISSLGKRLIKSGCVLLQKKYKKSCLQFGTATLPSLSNDDLTKVRDNWASIVKKFIQELRRLLKRRGLGTDILYVVEIQEKRYLAWGQICPHLHWLMQGKARYENDWAITPEEIKKLWMRQLVRLLGKGINCDASTRIEGLKKSPAREMAKYLSKGGKLWKEIQAAGKGDQLPTSYWGISKELKAEIKAAIDVKTGEDARKFIADLEQMAADKVLVYREVRIELDGRSRVVGYVGWIYLDKLAKFRGLTLCQSQNRSVQFADSA